MRLGEMYFKCKSNYNYIKFKFIEILELMKESKGIENDKIKYLSEKEIQTKIDILIKEIDNSLSDIIFLPTIHLPENYSDMLTTILSIYHLLLALETTIDIYETLQMDVDKTQIGLNIKLPPTDSITEFRKNIEDIEFLFTNCPFIQSEENSIKFQSVDIGSVWLVVGVACISITAGSILLNNIVALIDKCMILKSHKLTILKQAQRLEVMKHNEEEKEKLIKNLVKLYQVSVNNVIFEMEESSGYNIESEEDRKKAYQSLEILGKLLDKGLQIHASIESPDEIKALFEPLNLHYIALEEELKKIEKKKEKGE